MPGAVLRPRTDADLPALAALLGRQQAATQYPWHWPLGSPVESFIKRDNELRAWVAVVADEVVGHVAVTQVDDDASNLTAAWTGSHQAPVDELRCVSVLFTDPDLSGRGIGSALLDTATAFAVADGYPVLDVVAANERPVRLYERSGWLRVGTMLAPWSPQEPVMVHAMILPRSR